ncbi:type II toxin-antitoxin system HicA family toxin [Capnocytophaga sp. ARDL2]|uniref:type II toxin-antitoxin system HicA family toxin n=1 Tax=Capnocytophaga sp. ARDL2 TaxID=3238809 RepID=UPI0035592259
MKYSELERLLRKNGCYDTGKQANGHPVWFSPITGQKFRTSNHKSEEVKIKTLKSISKQSGVKI